ncbi:MAG: hypothetical protein GX087_10610 [Desulfobulbaceae bacterium]|nr:hypothetical protein [Desulfobulbaceae bacterium]
MELPPSFLEVFFSWRTLLDIALISTGLFFLQRTLMRLGTWKIMAGIFLALFVFIGANLLDLRGIEWIYNNVSHVALIGLIVIFQPELRKVLERAVWAPPRGAQINDERLPKLIANCLSALAKDYCGALIVYPGREPIGEKTTGGFVLNAVPSYPLILSLFDPNSPGHDGAIIIVGDRITRFGVRLPMSNSSRLANSYGTRHHAAMGLAEQTDALALVVSEERGQVSAFFDGQMQLIEGTEEISDIIIGHLESVGLMRKKRSSWALNKDALLHGVVSLLIATAFSLSVLDTARNTVERSVIAAVDYTASAADGSVLVGDRATEVKLHLSGPLTEMETLTQNPPHVAIDLRVLDQGKHSVVLTSDNLTLPKNVTLLDVSPAQLDLTLVPMEEKSMPITPQLVGKLPAGLKLKKVTLIPEGVEVVMPKTKNDRDSYKILTTPIYLDSITTDSRIFCGIIARPSIQPLAKRWPDVEVVIEVETKPQVGGKKD